MSALGKYYILSSFIFLISFIINVIFVRKYSKCNLYPNSPLLILLISIINFVIFFLMFIDGLLINYFSSKDNRSFISYGIFKKIISIITKSIPFVNKLLNLLKTFLIFVLFALVLMSLFFKYSAGNENMFSNNRYYHEDEENNKYKSFTCSDNSIIEFDLYESNLLAFFIIEFGLNFVIVFILAIIKSFVPEEGFMYYPLDRKSGRIKKLIYQILGP